MLCNIWIIFGLVLFIVTLFYSANMLPVEVLYVCGLIAFILAIIGVSKANREHFYNKDKRVK